jgi:hypothetical protein
MGLAILNEIKTEISNLTAGRVFGLALLFESFIGCKMLEATVILFSALLGSVGLVEIPRNVSSL